jgi:hypothetical protein
MCAALNQSTVTVGTCTFKGGLQRVTLSDEGLLSLGGKCLSAVRDQQTRKLCISQYDLTVMSPDDQQACSLSLSRHALISTRTTQQAPSVCLKMNATSRTEVCDIEVPMSVAILLRNGTMRGCL